ncbi:MULTISPECIES: hypothetical protein [Pseudomonas]|uniref:hypothetical protein n=1 Tax=Pseudomonas TaxID=286 RepID=UPI0006B9D263|nr:MULTISPECIES: hypothetical protein [Pseudomonas]MCF5032849.1 hypothetical protein [Pseudomonas syringae]POD19814.1 hypothetical protein BKM12_11705 [Pseudomonas syringae pv. syringae]PUB37110.1 hypothetical protein C8K58_1282 [Pseudomonas sp. GV047]UQB21754.1 hypothetical protein I9H08_08065 [Pseudomonas syringae pv. syringae]WHN05934.1 hypothetical protein QMB36_05745 [Pseudomonas syringae pv. syringae]
MSFYTFNPHSKTFYRPIDAALRWCNLIRYEAQIVQARWSRPEELASLFPQWPCLHAAIEKIYDAVRNGELTYGCLGISVPRGSYVEPYQLTIRHSDLRHWMQVYYPDQKPGFLFESSRDAHENVSLGTFLALQADRDTLLRELNTLQHHLQDISVDLQAIGLERDDLKAMVKTHGQLSERSEITYQNIIGVLVNLFLDHSPSGKPLSVFKNQAAIVDAVIARHQDVPGLSKRTLDEKFAAANRSLKKSK